LFGHCPPQSSDFAGIREFDRQVVQKPTYVLSTSLSVKISDFAATSNTRLDRNRVSPFYAAAIRRYMSALLNFPKRNLITTPTLHRHSSV
jgi:hypothetical protein